MFNKSHKIKGYHRLPGDRVNKYQAMIKKDGRIIHIGVYPTEEQAHEAYLNKRKELFPGADELDRGRQ